MNYMKRARFVEVWPKYDDSIRENQKVDNGSSRNMQSSRCEYLESLRADLIESR